MTTLANARRLNHDIQPSDYRKLVAEYQRLGEENLARLAEAKALQYERGPVQILDLQVRHNDRYSNPPCVELLLSRLPKPEEYIYATNGALHYAEVDGICSYFHYSSPGRGYGGRRFPILMDTGEEKTLIGPWSSGSYAMNETGFGPCMEVNATIDPEVMKRGHTFFGGVGIRIDKILPALKERSLGLVRMASNTHEVTSRAKYPDRPYHAKSCKPGSMGSFSTVTEVILEPTD